jgi:periplasmic copper chaperone A
MRTPGGRLAVALLSVLILVAGCSTAAGPGTPAVSGAWVRAPMGEGRPAAGYLTITGASSADALVSAESPAAMRVEVHETYSGGSGMGMREVEKIDIPAGSTVRLEPGGYHLMLMGPKASEIAIGRTVEITLTFEKAGNVTIAAEVRQG